MFEEVKFPGTVPQLGTCLSNMKMADLGESVSSMRFGNLEHKSLKAQWRGNSGSDWFVGVPLPSSSDSAGGWTLVNGGRQDDSILCNRERTYLERLLSVVLLRGCNNPVVIGSCGEARAVCRVNKIT